MIGLFVRFSNLSDFFEFPVFFKLQDGKVFLDLERKEKCVRKQAAGEELSTSMARVRVLGFYFFILIIFVFNLFLVNSLKILIYKCK